MKKYKWFFVPLVGNIFEWYEFAIFSSLSTIIGKIFFNNNDQFSATASGFLIYGIAYLARPVGTLIFGYLGDRFGRKKALSISLLVMSLSTLVIPFLPSYMEIGASASLLLIAVRMIQGISLGGEFSAVVTYTCENAPVGKKGFFGATQSAGPIYGLLLGFFTILELNNAYTDQEILDFAWRIPFFLGVALGVIGIYTRLSCEETGEFLKLKSENRTVKNPLMYLFRNHFRAFMLGCSVLFTVSILTQTFTVGAKSILEIIFKFEKNTASKLSMMLAVFSIAFIWLSGVITEKFALIKVRKIYTIITAILSFMAICIFRIPGGAIYGMFLMVFLSSLWLGFYPYYLYKNIPTQVRDTGVGFSIGIPVLLTGFSMAIVMQLFKDYSFSGMYAFILIINIVTIIGFVCDQKLNKLT